MKFLSFTFFLVFICVSGTFPQSKKNIKSLLWKIEYPGTNHISYILGTNHSLGHDWLKKFSFLNQLISSADAMYSETGNMPKTNTNIVSDSTNLQPARNMNAIFGRDSSLVDSFMTTYLGLPIPLSEMLKNSTITEKGYTGQKSFLFGLDALMDIKLLSDLSNRKGLISETFNLGKIETLDNLLEKIAVPHIPLLPLDNQKDLDELFESTKFESSNTIKKIKEYRDYQNGITSKKIRDLESDLELLYNGKMDFSQAYKNKITSTVQKSAIDRNNDWVKKLTKELKQKNLFIAFGSGHLIINRKYGVLDQLKKAGFKATPINMLEHTLHTHSKK